MNYPETLAWIHGTERFGSRLGLGRMGRLLQKTQQAAGELLARDPQLDTLPALSRRVDRLMAKMSL